MQNELDIIANIRNEVISREEHTGENLFLAWGYPTAFFLLVEFFALKIWNEFWCEWIWLGIPIIGAPLMMHFIKKDYERTGRKTINEMVILKMWIFVGIVSCIGGATMGFAGVFEKLYCTFQGLFIAFGCFMTGIILHFRPKTICGIIGMVVTFLALFFQGDQWPWQLLIASIVTIITLIIPGHLYRHYVRKSY